MKNKLLLLILLCLTSAVAFAQSFAYITNRGSDDLSVIDLSTNTVTATIPTIDNTFAVATDNVNRKVYVATTDNSILVIDATANIVEDTITMENASSDIRGLALSLDGSTLYAADSWFGVLRVIDLADNSITEGPDIGFNSFDLVISPDGSKLYSLNSTNDFVTVIDVATNMSDGTFTAGDGPNSMAFHPNGNVGYITNLFGNTVSVVDLTTNMVTNTIAVGTGPYGLQVGGTSFDKLYVANSTGSSVSVIDLATEMVTATLSVGAGPTAVAVTEDGSTVYVISGQVNAVNIIDAATDIVTGTVDVGTFPNSLGDFILDPGPTPGAALAFDGVDDRVVMPVDDFFPGLIGNYTVSAWVNITDNTVDQPIFHTAGFSIETGIFFSANAPSLGNRPLFQIRFPDPSQPSNFIVIGPETLSTGEWHHIAVSFRSFSPQLNLYIDQELVATLNNVTLTADDVDALLQQAYIGYSPYEVGGGGGYFSGQMDELRILNTVYSCHQVEQLTNCELADDNANLVSYYRFNQGVAGEDNSMLTELEAVAGPNGMLEGFALSGTSSNFIAEGAVASGVTCNPEVISPGLRVSGGNSPAIGDGDDTPTTFDGTDIGNVTVGQTGSSTFVLNNNDDNSDLGIMNLMSSNPLFTFDYNEPNLVVTFSPDAAGVQTSVISFDHADCFLDNDFSFTVQGNGVIVAALSLNTTAACENAGPVTGLGGGTPAGGIYSGTGVTDDGNGMTFSFDPMAAGVGEAMVTYTVSGSSASGSITVNPPPAVTFSTGMLSVAEDAGVQTGLGGGTPVGGVYMGAGVTDDGNGMTYSFDPAVAGVGTINVNYTFTDANGCTAGLADPISVTAAALPGDVCADAIDISSLLGGEINAPQVSDVQDNTSYDAEGDPGIGYDCFGGDPILNNTIWYAFTGDGNKYSIRSLQCSDDNPMTNNDTQFALYSGDCENPVAVACNEDEDFASDIYNAYIEIVTEPGVNYVLMVDGYVNASEYAAIGTFCLEVTRQEVVGVQDINETPFKVYPNPTSGQLQLDGFTADHITVFDQLGRLVHTENQQGQGCDLGHLPSGVYFLKMTADGEVYTARIVKE